MKKILLLSAFISCCTLQAFSQTKKIAHRSHSGNDADMQYDGDDNFGLPPEYKKERAKADSVARAKADSTKKAASRKTIIKRKEHSEAVLPKKSKQAKTITNP